MHEGNMRQILRAINKRAARELPTAYKRLRLIDFKWWVMPPVSSSSGAMGCCRTRNWVLLCEYERGEAESPEYDCAGNYATLSSPDISRRRARMDTAQCETKIVG
ncbi:hypothetical protein B0H13DRAFT_2276877 [Mycena leptocephala]|nr:hypothetical protein B0H13DRAFT_2276877 [Mycena leptocephala]